MQEQKRIRVTLENGLTVLLQEVRSAPLISQWVWYRVGARNEKPGKTGISHWVEHMQFKGTEKYGPGVLDRAISRVGGVWNAMTSDDWTTYYETVPSSEIDLCLSLEADRMANSLYPEDEVASERTVVLSEREGLENEPAFRLDDAVKRIAYRSHPYRNEVIGETADLLAMTRDDLYAHYQRYYAPNNAVLSLAGDFDLNDMLEKVRLHFGAIPAGAPVHDEIAPEGPIEAAETVRVSGPGQLTYVQMAWRAPVATDADFFNLAILTSILAGPPNLNQFGVGGIGNRMSRLYGALVNSGLAVGIAGDFTSSIDPGLFTVTVVLNEGVAPETVTEIVDREIARIAAGELSDEELRIAVKQARAMFIFGSENITNLAFWIGYAEMFADVSWFDTYVDRIAAVRREDVIDYARRCLAPNMRVVGIYEPTGDDESDSDDCFNTGESGNNGAEE